MQRQVDPEGHHQERPDYQDHDSEGDGNAGQRGNLDELEQELGRPNHVYPQRPRVPGPLDPGRMDLDDFETEIGWAAILKIVMEQTGISRLSDFDLVQIMAVEGDALDSAVEMAQRLHHFREEYEVDDSVESGRFCVSEAMKLFPGFFLALTFTREANRGHYTLVLDVTKLNSGLLKPGENGMKTFLMAVYFCFQAMTPDFEASRHGALLLVECDQFNSKQNVTLGQLKHAHNELFLPTKWHQARHYNTGVFFHVLMSMLRPFLPDDLQGKVQLGCKSPTGRLDHIYLQPTLEAANQRFLERLTDALRRRYANESKFTLAPIPEEVT
ncbi:expressed unknown protein [Seminavis robusta]|uniref:Uncharacterized protein n=1 Tax=Seminavis robusta TaxID=568900 RepID=A0A9N8DFB1_9STRA|nr:expressed unknown protein [Seminavis robusta]|eukprot:Sro130_g061780.1 n/a (327) ;mRNA; r:18065-19045